MDKIAYIKIATTELMLSFENVSANYFIKSSSGRMNQNFSVCFASVIYEFDIKFLLILIRFYFCTPSI